MGIRIITEPDVECVDRKQYYYLSMILKLPATKDQGNPKSLKYKERQGM